MSLIRLRQVTKRYDNRLVLREVSLRVRAGERIGLVGPNASGKTTILRLMLGRDEPTEGDVEIAAGLRLGYFSQFSELDSDLSVQQVLEEVLADVRAVERELGEIEEALNAGPPEAEMTALLDRQAPLMEEMHRRDGWNWQNRIDTVLSRMEFAAEDRRRPLHQLSGGWRNRAALAKILLEEPDVLFLDEPTTLRYVGAVAFHSWGGAEPKTYAAWADLADRLKLPLLVTEMGVDANWAGRPTELPGYWLRELRQYQELLLYARPTATMQLEFTSDYSLVDWRKAAPAGLGAGQVVIEPTDRFFLIQQLSTLTPPKADVLATTSDHPKVLMTAAIASAATGKAADGLVKEPALTIHVANLAASRGAEITGLPPTIRTLRVFRTSSTDHCREVEPVKIESGRVQLTLPAQSLTTLTSAEP